MPDAVIGLIVLCGVLWLAVILLVLYRLLDRTKWGNRIVAWIGCAAFGIALVAGLRMFT